MWISWGVVTLIAEQNFLTPLLASQTRPRITSWLLGGILCSEPPDVRAREASCENFVPRYVWARGKGRRRATILKSIEDLPQIDIGVFFLWWQIFIERATKTTREVKENRASDSEKCVARRPLTKTT